MRLLRGFRFVIAILTCLGVAPALAEVKLLTHDTRFCPSWAEAHERTIASLNNGRPAYPVKWKGCIMLKRGTPVDVVDQQEESTENCCPRQTLVHGRVADISPPRRSSPSFRGAPNRQSLFRPNPNPN
ncbi:MAG TPA: hypothetical protein VGH47_10015 [Xanthobacteraceae bacterium]